MSTNTFDISTGNQPTVALNLIKHFGISKRGVARQLGMSPITVRRALAPNTFAGVSHRCVHTVRIRVQHLLIAAGWEGNPDDLWLEYDIKLAA